MTLTRAVINKIMVVTPSRQLLMANSIKRYNKTSMTIRVDRDKTNYLTAFPIKIPHLKTVKKGLLTLVRYEAKVYSQNRRSGSLIKISKSHIPA